MSIHAHALTPVGLSVGGQVGGYWCVRRSEASHSLELGLGMCGVLFLQCLVY